MKASRTASPIAASALRSRGGRLSMALALGLVVALSIGVSGFFDATNLANLVWQNTALLSVALGQMVVVIAGGLDVSVGSVVSLTTVILAMDLPWPVVLVMAIVAGFVVGLVNGIGISRFGVHPIIMTISTMSIVQGLVLALRDVPGGSAPAGLVWLMATDMAGVPLSLLWSGALVLACAFLLYRTPQGLRFYAVGGSSPNARLAGLNVAWIVTSSYVVSALSGVLGGLQVAGRIGSADPLVGASFAVDAITVVALGGTLLSGGIGGVGGTVAGVVMLALIANGMNHLDVPVFYQQALRGVLLMAVVAVYRRKEPGL